MLIRRPTDELGFVSERKGEPGHAPTEPLEALVSGGKRIRSRISQGLAATRRKRPDAESVRIGLSVSFSPATRTFIPTPPGPATQHRDGTHLGE